MKPFFQPSKSFLDDRGYSFFNIFEEEDMHGQINIGNVFPGVIKAFHYHKLQADWWFCIKGNIHTICVTPKDESLVDSNNKDDFTIRHFYFGEHNPGVLVIPEFTWHGYTNLGSEQSTLLYWVTQPYNAANSDEYRKPWDIFGKELWQVENK